MGVDPLGPRGASLGRGLGAAGRRDGDGSLGQLHELRAMHHKVSMIV